MNCNFEAHTICTEQMNFQTPAPDQLIITHLDFSYGGKERYKKHPMLIALILYFVFCVKHEWSRRNSIQQRSLVLHAKIRRERWDHQLYWCIIYVRLLSMRHWWANRVHEKCLIMYCLFVWFIILVLYNQQHCRPTFTECMRAYLPSPPMGWMLIFVHRFQAFCLRRFDDVGARYLEIENCGTNWRGHLPSRCRYEDGMLHWFSIDGWQHRS